ncbi:MAG TPA: hypothetical protein ENN13_04800 [Candidatus Altiarchaeales archaeon]|nr:hypothetical protein [Candidatus Altiarchaeales archaeon]
MKTVTDARKSKKHLYDTIRLLNNMELSGRTNMGVSATQYNKLIKSKSYVIVLSDFLEDLPSIKEGVHRLSRRSLELTLIQVLDPWETDLGWRMDVNFEDMETDEVKRTYISPGFKKEYGERIKSHTRSVQELANDFGAEFITVNTQKPLIDVFIELMGGIKRGD